MIGVIGGYGAVGAAASRLLTQWGAGPLRIAGRDRDRAARLAAELNGPGRPAAAEPAVCDANDPASLAAFVHGCDLVVHCAGPSHRTSAPVVAAALAAGADVVDAGGGAGEAAPAGRTVLYDAGAVPGLTGLLPRHLAAAHFDGAHTLTAHTGVLDRFTDTGADDYLHGVLSPAARPLAAWRQGTPRPGALTRRTDLHLPFLPRPVTALPYLDAEAEGVARDLSLAHGDWYTAVDGEHLAAALAAARTARRADAVRALRRATALDTAGRTPYTTLLVQLDGTRGGRPATRTAVLRAGRVAELTGAVAAVAALAVRRGAVPPGTYRADQALDPAAALARLTAPTAPVCRLDVHRTPIDALTAVEEGAL
ncbi:saccharopine dehydrogenase NADP-binding domain-containing protein [Streptomyces sp. NPDC050617]|uniref:saccharopine dehydrogenase NADP-binding domain-containing protein n=1 Tax=Streptomyces sp. NPDC050617 TaxID=3154628 RepID=UPI0034337511